MAQADRVVYRQALEAFDYERWRESTILFEAAASEAPDGSRRDVQVYGQRWVPFVPHWFLAASLFEIGKYELALRYWRLSRDQVTAADQDRRTGDLLPYSSRRLKTLAPVRRLAHEITPGELAATADRLRALEVRLERLLRSVEALPRAEGERWLSTLARFEGRLASLSSRHSQLEGESSESTRERPEERLDALTEAVAFHGRVRRLAEAVAILDAETAGALVSLRGDFVEGLRESLDGRPAAGLSLRRPRPGLRIELASTVRGDASCGYSGLEPSETWRRALSDYIAGTAVARSLECHEIQAIAIPRLRCSLAARSAAPAGAGFDYWPNRSLSLAAARCGDRAAARAALAAYRERRGRGADGDVTARTIADWLEGEQQGYPGRSRAVVIGAWDYTHWPDLPGARRDYHRLQEALSAQGFEVEAIANPDRRDLEDLIEHLDGTTQPGDRLLVYYAGHGHLSRSEELDVEVGWIVPTNAPPSGAPDFASYGISMDQVRKWSLADLDSARQQLFVFDSCFAGQLFLAGDRARCRFDQTAKKRALDFPFLTPDAPPGGLTWIERQPVRIWMSAGTAEQRVADRSHYSESFARALLGDEPEADRDEDGYLHTDSELAPFLRNRVRELSAQTPETQSLCGEGDFVFRLGEGAAMPAPPDSAHCASEPLATLEEIFRWEALARVGAYEDYLDSTRCGLFAPLARRILASSPR